MINAASGLVVWLWLELAFRATDAPVCTGIQHKACCACGDGGRGNGGRGSSGADVGPLVGGNLAIALDDDSKLELFFAAVSLAFEISAVPMPFLHFHRSARDRNALVDNAVATFGAHAAHSSNLAAAIAPKLPSTY